MVIIAIGVPSSMLPSKASCWTMFTYDTSILEVLLPEKKHVFNRYKNANTVSAIHMNLKMLVRFLLSLGLLIKDIPFILAIKDYY